jgi:hypothetical protein
MGDCCDMYGRRPDGELEPSGQTTVRQKFYDFCWKSFLFESSIRTVRYCRPDGRTSAASNLHIRVRASGPSGWPSGRLIFNMQFPYQMSVRPDHDRQASRRLKLNSQFPYLLNAHPEKADWRPDGCIWNAILTLCMNASGRESTSSGRLHQSSLIWTWKENMKLIDHWTSSGWAAETSGQMQAGTEVSRYSEESG